MDTNLAADTSVNVSGAAGVMVSAEANMGAETGSMVVVEICVSVGIISSVCAVVSAGSAPVGAQMILTVGAGSETEVVVVAEAEVNVSLFSVTTDAAGAGMKAAAADAEIYVGVGMIVSVCAAVSVGSVPVGVQMNITVGVEANAVAGLEMKVAAVVDIHVGMSSEMVGVAGVVPSVEVDVNVATVCAEMGTAVAGVSTKMLTSVGSVVGQTEWKIGSCEAFNVGVVGQDMNTVWGVMLSSGAGTGAGVGAGTELVVRAGTDAETEVLQITGGMWAFCSQGKT